MDPPAAAPLPRLRRSGKYSATHGALVGFLQNDSEVGRMHDGEHLRIEVMPRDGRVEEIKRRLEPALRDVEGVSLELAPAVSGFRGVEPSVLVALVAGAGGALSALIAGLLAISQQRAGKGIVIQGKSGARLEVPADTPDERIHALVEQVRNMDCPRIAL